MGTNLLGLVKAAEKNGFMAKAVLGPYDALPEVPLPAIAHVRTNEELGHFVVLHRVSPQRVIIADPAHGIETLSKEEFSKRWSGYLLLLTPGEGSTPRTETTQARGPAVRFHHPLVRFRSREMMEHSAKLSAHYVEDVSAVEAIKAFGAERQRIEEGESRLVRVVQAEFSL